MVRSWIVVLVVALGGCSDDGTVGAGETGASAGTTSAAETSGVLTSGPTDPSSATQSATTNDPSTASSSEDGSVSTGEASSSASSTSDEPTSTGSGSGSSSGSSSSGGEPEFIPCFPDGGEECPDGLTCWTSVCCFGQGFCVDPDVGACGGFGGDPCEDPSAVCVIDLCVDDGDGVCVSPDFSDDVCMEQELCWASCMPD